MDKYLLQILKETNTIIIPGLGALTITNTETGEIMFMPYLKHDDGNLANYIAENEGWELNDAKNLIAKYVRDILTKLEKGEEYSMYEFGTFRMEAGDIEFINWYKSNQADSQDENSEIIVPLPAEEIEPEVEEVTSADEIEEEPIAKPEEIQKDPDPVVEKEIEEVKPIEPEIIEVNETPDNNDQQENEIREKDEPVHIYAEPEINNALPDEEKTEEKVYYQEVVIEEKSGRGVVFWSLMVLLTILVTGGIFLAVFYEEAKAYFPFLQQTEESVTDEEQQEDEVPYDENAIENNQEETISEVPEDTLASENTEVLVTESEEDIKTTNVQPVIESSNTPETGKPYHVIGGAFMEKSNADRYADKLSIEGNPSVIVGRFDSLYLVSIRSFSSPAEARENLNSLQSISSKAWIFKWP